jgi:hypothetical protein
LAAGEDGKRVQDHTVNWWARHEAPAAIDQKAQPATAVRSLKTAQAVTATRGIGFRSALASPPVTPAGFSFALSGVVTR